MDNVFSEDEEPPECLKSFYERTKERRERTTGLVRQSIQEAETLPWPSEPRILSEEERKILITEALDDAERIREEVTLAGEFTVRFSETPTMILFDLAPLVSVRGTGDAEECTTWNDILHKNKAKKDPLRIKDSVTQTIPTHFYRDFVQTDPIIKKDMGCSASEWLIYDAYKNTDKSKPTGNKGNNIRISNVKENTKMRNSRKKIPLGSNEKFKEASLICCRVLASNTFCDEQLLFASKHQPSRSFSYQLNELWKLKGAGAVSHICWSVENPKVVAVGHGDRSGPGRINVWHAKCPEAVERTTQTKAAVTCLQFSRTQPALLAAVTRDGSVLIVDITKHETTFTLINKDTLSPYPFPLWFLCWFTYDNNLTREERLLTVGQTGLVQMWDPIKGKKEQLMAKLSFISAPDEETKLTGQPPLTSQQSENIDFKYSFIQVPLIGLYLSVDPSDRRRILVTTDVGLVASCRTNKEPEDWEKLPISNMFPIFCLEHSPFLPKLFMTCAGDGVTTLWIHGMTNPIVQLSTSDLCFYPVEGGEWSPSHSSVLVTFTREEVCLWDISRSTDKPMRLLRNSDSHYTAVRFSSSGTNLFVGCNDGCVTVYRLNEMPHPPYLQREHLENALRKVLNKQKELLKELEIALKES